MSLSMCAGMSEIAFTSILFGQSLHSALGGDPKIKGFSMQTVMTDQTVWICKLI